VKGTGLGEFMFAVAARLHRQAVDPGGSCAHDIPYAVTES
jgi:hypothetical protein